MEKRLAPHCVSPPFRSRMEDVDDTGQFQFGYLSNNCLTPPTAMGYHHAEFEGIPVHPAQVIGHQKIRKRPNIVTPRNSFRNRSPSTTKKPSKKRCTTKSSTDKPHRPLSAYNLFFRDERAKIVSASEKGEVKKQTGKVGFAEMARLIAPRWKALDEETRIKYETRAVDERKKYFIALEAYERSQEQERTATRDHHFTENVYLSPRSSATTKPPSELQAPLLPLLEDSQALVNDKELDQFLSTVDFS